MAHLKPVEAVFVQLYAAVVANGWRHVSRCCRSRHREVQARGSGCDAQCRSGVFRCTTSENAYYSLVKQSNVDSFLMVNIPNFYLLANDAFICSWLS
jgi:hypothetical protein